MAWLFVRDLGARVALLAAPAALFALVLFPGVLTALDEIAGADAITWRLVWIVPVPAAVGIVASAPLRLLPDRPRAAVLTAIVPAVLLAVLVNWGTAVVSRFNVPAGTRPSGT